ncbi:hypothetical protein NFJ02_35g88510 [Pycnococcus provasolii]
MSSSSGGPPPPPRPSGARPRPRGKKKTKPSTEEYAAYAAGGLVGMWTLKKLFATMTRPASRKSGDKTARKLFLESKAKAKRERGAEADELELDEELAEEYWAYVRNLAKESGGAWPEAMRELRDAVSRASAAERENLRAAYQRKKLADLRQIRNSYEEFANQLAALAANTENEDVKEQLLQLAEGGQQLMAHTVASPPRPTGSVQGTRFDRLRKARVEERVSELVDNDHYNIKMPYSSLRFDGPSHASFLRVGGEDGREPQDEIEEARRRAWKPASSPPKPLGQGNAAPLSAESATAPQM